MAKYKTPGVYIEEISTLPRSVAGVSTAVPAFVGFTEKGPDLARIDTMLEFEHTFGGPPPAKFAVTVENSETLSIQPGAETDNYYLYYSMRLYFENGGGQCYVSRAGGYDAAIAGADLEKALGRLETEDEPTLLCFPDAIRLDAADAKSLIAKALAQCEQLKDRLVILDVPMQRPASVLGDAKDFRDNRIGTGSLSYGAAYYPYLFTSFSYHHDDENVIVSAPTGDRSAEADDDSPRTLANLSAENPGLYHRVKEAMREQRVTLPPGGAIAGVYVRMDRSRGVWKAPANIDLASVIRPAIEITDARQEVLNLDPVAGKSINAIREFAGRGTLVWGARTLAGNDAEWRYIAVRRLCNMIEESTRKATKFAVYEPNDLNTWQKVKGMIDNYLQGLWKQGALAGPSPDQAFFVNVGLGETMTPLDVLEGRMIVEIGLAPVRPAEFIILRFMHKLPEA